MLALEVAEQSTGRAILSRLCNHLARTGSDINSLLDRTEGVLDVAEFQLLLKKVDIEMGTESTAHAMKDLDVDGDGSLQISELSACLTEFKRTRRVFASEVLGHVVDFVDQTNTSLPRLFARVDSDGSGTLDVFELQEAMRRLHQDLNDMDVIDLLQELDLVKFADDGSGSDSGAGDLEQISCPQFLDKLLLFKSERTADAAKCEELYNQFDRDGDGYLDHAELKQLAEYMGLRDQMESRPNFIEALVADIQKTRLLGGLVDASEAPEPSENGVIFKEFQRWCVG